MKLPKVFDPPLNLREKVVFTGVALMVLGSILDACWLLRHA